MLTSCFIVYQFYNEEKHVEENTLEKVKGVADQSMAFIYWAYEQKAKALSDEEKYHLRDNDSLKELLSVLEQQSDIKFDISLATNELNATALKPMPNTTLVKIKERQKDGFIISNHAGEKKSFLCQTYVCHCDVYLLSCA